jgi:hypothetical protein
LNSLVILQRIWHERCWNPDDGLIMMKGMKRFGEAQRFKTVCE